MLKRPIFPYIEIGCISAVTSGIIFLSHSLSLLFTDAPFFVVPPSDVGAVSSMSALTYDEEKLENISMAVSYDVGVGVGSETAREWCLEEDNKASTSKHKGIQLHNIYINMYCFNVDI